MSNLYYKIQFLSGQNNIRRNVGSYSGFANDLEQFVQDSFNLAEGTSWSVFDCCPFFIGCEYPITIEISIGESTIQSIVNSATMIDFPVDHIKITATQDTKIQIMYGS